MPNSRISLSTPTPPPLQDKGTYQQDIGDSHIYPMLMTMSLMAMEQQEGDGGGHRREHTDAEAVPSVHHLSLGVQDVVHQGHLHLNHLVQTALLQEIRSMSVSCIVDQPLDHFLGKPKRSVSHQ